MRSWEATESTVLGEGTPTAETATIPLIGFVMVVSVHITIKSRHGELLTVNAYALGSMTNNTNPSP